MFTQWATRRLFKFLLKKRIGRYIRGDLDLEQLDVQLGSGVVQLNDVALNVDYINGELADSSVALKEGSLGTITLKLQWKVLPTIEIELDEVELVFVPRKSDSKFQPKNKSSALNEYTFEVQQLGLESELAGLGSVGACTYLPVQEGVKVVANLVESLLLGMHVSVQRAIIAFEEQPSAKRSRAMEELPMESTRVSHSMLVLRVGCVEYGIDYFSRCEDSRNRDDRHSAELPTLTKAIHFQQMTLELLDVLDDGCECPSSMTRGGKVFGQPISILRDDDSLLGCIQLSIPWKSGCLDIPKLDADISISHINLQVTGHQIQQLLAVVSSYGDCSSSNTVSAESHDTNQYSALCNNGLSSIKEADDSKDRRGATAAEPALLGSHIRSSRSSLLPGARLISDWVHWNDQDKYTREEAMSEAEFVASTEEFFDCFDGTRSSQASLSGSGLWTWTCSAFSAITAASSLASGSVLISQELARQVEYDFKVKMAGVSVILKEGDTPQKKMNSVLGKDIGAASSPGTRNQKSLVSWLSESVTARSDYSSDDHIEASFSDISLCLQVSQRCLEWQLIVKQIEACEIQYEQLDVGLSHEQNGDIILQTISSSAQPLQALVEQSLPRFPVSLCEGMESVTQSAVTKKCFLRLSDQGHLAAGQVDGRRDFPSVSSDSKGSKSQGLTHIDIHFQPLVVWFDASVICKLHKLADIFGHPSNDLKTSHPVDIGGCTTRASLSSRSNVHADMYVPRLRLLACLPPAPGSRLSKDHLLCLDLSAPAENSKRPFFNVNLPDMVQTKGNPPCAGSFTFALGDSCLYLVSPSVNVQNSAKHVALGFNAQKVLSISLCSSEVATVEILLRTKSAAGIWLAERAWNGVTEQQKGGMGGRKMNSEFAAATATEGMDENNRKIREDILVCSSTYVHVTIPCVKVELFGSQHTIVLGLLSSLIETSTLQTLDSGSPSLNTQYKDSSQTSILVDVGKVEIIAHPRVFEPNAGPTAERKGNSPWGSYMISITRFQILHVVNLGMMSASYFWLCHENGSVGGLLVDGSCGELQLLTCRDDALGRGDGRGGNALATSSAGIELSVISWPDGDHAEDMLVTFTIQGCTFMAHGGRLDWLPGLITFFSQHADKGPTVQAIHEKSWSPSAAETSLVMLQVGTFETEEDALSAGNNVMFSLDLHDVALCYEPGTEAESPANLRARSMGEAQPSDIEQFAPVACAVAAAAVRISSNAISNNTNKDYKIWLRDVALLLVDTTLRQHKVWDYTPESLYQAGYVKVAGEAVMEAVVRINGEEGLQWEVECANNQLRLDTCHDTTAALGRLIAQLQQLFAPEVERPPMDKKDEHEAVACCARECFGVQSVGGSTDINVSHSNMVNSENAVIFEGILEDAFTFVRGCSLHTDSSSCDCVDVEVRKGESLEMLGRSDLSSDDAADESLYNSLDPLFQDGGKAKDFWTPVSQNDEVPPFIEDYYVTKKSSLHSSQSSSCKDSNRLWQYSQHSTDDFDMLSTAEGSGGWYEGHSFKVVENHVPLVSNRSGSNKKRGSLFHTFNKRLGLSLKYPPSVGRVVLQDLNLRWRLYGGSDWLVTRTKDSVGLSYASQTHGGRQTGLCLEVIFNGVELQHDMFPETGPYASRLAVSIRDVRIYDCSKDAPWKKVLGYHRSKSCPRESSAKALKLELESVRPDPMVPLEQYRLSVHLLPILLHLDQRHVDFLMNFFPSSATSSSQQLHLGYEEVFSPHLAGLEGSIFDTKAADANEEALLPFFQICELQPFSIRVDYVPRRVDIGALGTGNYVELFNLVSWKGIELQLKHVRAAGVHGWGALFGIMVGEWLEDISRNQIHKLLKGLGPIRPFFAVGSGAAKLIVLPAEHYKRDRRRLFRGMRKGAIAFLRSISLEAVGLGVQLAVGAHEILLHTESALGAVGLSSSLERVEMPVKVGQPGDLREGLQQACESLSRGLERTASTLIGNPLKAYQRGAGTSSAVVSALRAAPAAAVTPAAAAVGAVHRALLGVRNSLDPEHRRESEEKHSGPPPE